MTNEYGKAFETLAFNLHNNDFEVGQIVYLQLHPLGYRYPPHDGIRVEVVEKQGDGRFVVKVLEQERVIAPDVDPPEGEDILMWARWDALISEERREAAIAARAEHVAQLRDQHPTVPEE